MQQHNVLITGASSGIGRATALRFAQKGWRVFDLSRHGRSKEGIIHIDCDVIDEDSVHAAVEQAIRAAGKLDVVICNAGYGISGPIEFTRVEDAQRQLDVNYFGTLRTIQAVLPHLRANRAGRILMLSSVAAVLSIPYQAFYSSSKAAINALALALENELRPYHIGVSVLMPGDVSTGFTAARDKSNAGEDIYPRAAQAVATMEHDEQHGMTPDDMARILYHMATCRHLRPQYIGGGKYKVFCLLDRLLPKRAVNRLVGMFY